MIFPSQLSVLIWTVAYAAALHVVPSGRLHYYWQRELQERLAKHKIYYISYDLYWLVLLLFAGLYGTWWAIFFHNTVTDIWYALNAVFTFPIVALLLFHGRAYVTPMNFSLLGPVATIVLGGVVGQLAFTCLYVRDHTLPGDHKDMDAIGCIAGATAIVFVWALWNWVLTIYGGGRAWEEMFDSVQRSVDAVGQARAAKPANEPAPSSDSRHTPSIFKQFTRFQQFD